MAKRICRNCKKYLSKLSNVFVQIIKCNCPDHEIYLSKNTNVSVDALSWGLFCCAYEWSRSYGDINADSPWQIRLFFSAFSLVSSHKIIVAIHSELSTPASPFQKSHKDTRYHGAVHTLYHVLIFYLVNFQRRRDFVLLADCLLSMHTLTLNSVDNHKISTKKLAKLRRWVGRVLPQYTVRKLLWDFSKYLFFFCIDLDFLE